MIATNGIQMSFYKTTCPYCHTQHVSFKSIIATQHTNDSNLYSVFYICNHCNNGIVLLINSSISPDPHKYEGHLNTERFYQIIQMEPKIKPLDIPDFLPENLKKIFVQAAEHSRKPGFEDSTGMTCRKTLEKALSIIAPETNGLRLYNRIEKCLEKQLITPDLIEWAHIIRDDGNAAAHDDFNAEKAKDLFNFTYMFLIYTFTLPGMMKEKKEKNGA